MSLSPEIEMANRFIEVGIINGRVLDIYLSIINEARVALHMAELQDIRSIGVNNVDAIFRETESLSEVSQQTISDENAVDLLTSKLRTALTLEEEDDDNLFSLKEKVLAKNATHFDVSYSNEEGVLGLSCFVFNVYLEIDEISKFIEGDIVIQGSIYNVEYAPILCLIQFQSDDDMKSQTIQIAPWDIMITQPEEADMKPTFTITASLRGDVVDVGAASIEIFVDEKSAVPMIEIEDFNYSPFNYVRALHYMTRSVLSNGYIEQTAASASKADVGDESPNERENMRRVSSGLEDGETTPGQSINPNVFVEEVDGDIDEGLQAMIEQGVVLSASDQVIQAIKIATDYDDLMALQAEGYEVCCEQITEEGTLADQEHLWKFHVCALFGSSEDGGIEDILWLKTPKSIGTLPVLKGYTVYHDTDLTEIEDDYSVFLAIKTGPNPKFSKLTMVSCNVDLDHLLRSYLKSSNCLFRKCPAEICNAMRSICGLALTVPIATDDTDKYRIKDHHHSSQRNRDGEADDDDFSRVTDESSLDEEEGSEEEIVKRLLEELESLRDEKTEVVAANQELQKRCVSVLQKEKSLQIQNTTKAPAGGAAAEVAHHLDAEQYAEKEKLYNDTLELIFDTRAKLTRQQAEFDQLALDLQTRLDDKEFKAGEIASSFKEFKREILAKAVNSRTGKGISKRLINQFEMIEQKHEEDLERVRLKNISLRTTLRKLERALRAKEHLAEGLHMIDFEQLKIENQTLNEKIEERNEELAKLKRKKTVTVQVLTHVREKLRFVEKTNAIVKSELEGYENETLNMRTVLTETKKDRDRFKLENKELRRQQGFATSDLLLTDYESRKGQLDVMRAEIRELKAKYKVLANQAGVFDTGSTASSRGRPVATARSKSPFVGGVGGVVANLN